VIDEQRAISAAHVICPESLFLKSSHPYTHRLPITIGNPFV